MQARGRTSSIALTVLVIAGVLLGVALLRSRDADSRPARTVEAPGSAGEARAELALDGPAAPERESAAAVPPDSHASELVFAVVDADGLPVPNAQVALCDSTAPVSRRDPFLTGEAERTRPVARRTGASGRARFDAEPTSLDYVLVAAEGHVPFGARREIEHGEQTIALPGPVSITGRVTLDGAAPPQALPLTLRGFRDPAFEWCPIAREEASRLGLSNGELRVQTEPDGRFSITGIPEGEQVEILLPPALWLANTANGGAERRVRVTTIAKDVRIDLQAAPRILGRAGHGALADLDPSARPGAPLLLRCTQTSASGRTDQSTLIRRAGEPFVIPFFDRVLASIELSFEDGSKRLKMVRRTGRLDADVNLGWIDLDAPAATLTLRVADKGGRPILGAKARSGARVAGPSGADGLLQLPIDSGDDPLAVAAFGYELWRAPMPVPVPEVLDVRLTAANLLRLRLAPAPGAALSAGLTLSLRIPRGASPDDPEHLTEFADVRGTPPSGGGGDDDVQILTFRVPSSGVVERSDLPERLPIDLRVRNAWGEILIEDQFQLQRGEHLELERTLPAFLGSFRARVVAADDRPIAGAVVSFGQPFGPTVTSDADGVFELTDVATPALAFTVSADGFASRSVTVGEASGESSIRLERSRVLWVDVLDEHGARTDARVWAELAEGVEVEAGRVGPGRFRFDALALSARRLTAESEGGKRVVRELTDDASELTLRFGP